jgi:glucokinase
VSEAGRPPAIGLDVGGSSLKAALVNAGGRLSGEPREVPVTSGGSPEAILDDFANVLSPLLEGSPRGIGIGMPGPFDYQHGISLMQGLTKFDALYGLDLGRALRERLALAPDFPLLFQNDAAAFALGEIRYGAARDRDRALVLTLGTGCGSAFAIGGQLVTEGEGVPPGGYVYCLPYRDGMIDDHISSRGIARLWRETAGGEAPSVLEIACRARHGEETAHAVFERFGERVAEALLPTLRAFRPEVVVVGGRIAASFDLFAPGLTRALTGQACPPVVPAEHLATSALLGAASLVP